MQTFIKNNKLLIFIFSLSLIGGFLRFYNLNWGSPFYFHPDERNIAAFISSLSFYQDPEFFMKGTFAYGTFISYIVFFTKNILNTFLIQAGLVDPFSQSIILLRSISSISSILIIILTYHIGTIIAGKKIGILGSFMAAFSPGLIQAAHFGTFESFITLMYMITFLFTLLFAIRNKSIYFFLSFLAISIASAAKINSLVLAFIPLLLLTVQIKLKKITINNAIKYGILAVIILIFLTILLSSYYVTSDFKNLLIYERNLLTGSQTVFYTGEFINTIPIVYQFLHEFPFLMNPLITLLFIFALFYLTYKGLKTKNISFILLILFFLILFLPGAFLFAKWTRYIVPTLPFIYLITAITVIDLLKRRFSNIKHLILSAIIGICIVHTVSYFITVFVRQDTRIEGSFWAKENIPAQSIVLSEVYDMGIVPFNQYFSKITLFNFYDLDQIPETKSSELEIALKKSEYIILPSPRILKTRLLNQKKFPYGFNFYNDLTNGNLGYQKIYETPCDIFCKITYLGDPVFSFEQTANVFDHPTVYIFKKL